jgi:hypothetical protein
MKLSQSAWAPAAVSAPSFASLTSMPVARPAIASAAP